MAKNLIAAAAVLISVWALAGCNTVHGIGKDIESGGKAIERSSGR